MLKLSPLFKAFMLILCMGLAVPILAGCGAATSTTTSTSSSGSGGSGGTTAPTDAELVTQWMASFEAAVKAQDESKLSNLVSSSFSGKAPVFGTTLSQTSFVNWIKNGFPTLAAISTGDVTDDPILPSKAKTAVYALTTSEAPSVSGSTATVTASEILIGNGSAEVATAFVGPVAFNAVDYNSTFDLKNVTLTLTKGNGTWRLSGLSGGDPAGAAISFKKSSTNQFQLFLYAFKNGALVTDTSAAPSVDGLLLAGFSARNGTLGASQPSPPSADVTAAVSGLKSNTSPAVTFTFNHKVDIGQTK